MRQERFDLMTATFARTVSRRGAIGTLLGLVTAGWHSRRSAEAQDRCLAILGNTCPSNARCLAESCPGNRCCNGTCTNVFTDPSNCGECGNICSRGLICIEGQCILQCGESEVPCGDVCVNTGNDLANCGACGNACPAGTRCRRGQCVSVCEDGQTWCGDRCINLNRNEQNCGVCGNVCSEGTECKAGVCESVCAGGETWCGACVDLGADEGNCGSCGTTCPAGQTCRDGACVLVCDGGLTACAGECVDVNADTRHCGACGTQCPAGSTCVNGGCLIVEEGEERTVVRDAPALEVCVAEPVRPRRIARISEELAKPAPDRRMTTADADTLLAGLEPLPAEEMRPYVATLDGAVGCGNGGDLARLFGALSPEAGAEFLRSLGWSNGSGGSLLEQLASILPFPQRQWSAFSGQAEAFREEDGGVILRRAMVDAQRLVPEHIRLFRWGQGDEQNLGVPSMIIQDAWPSDAPLTVRVRSWMCQSGVTANAFIGEACGADDATDPAAMWAIHLDDGSGKPAQEPIPWESGVATIPSSSIAAGRAWLHLIAGGAVVPGLVPGSAIDGALAGWWIVPLAAETPDRVVDVYLLQE